MSNPRVLCRWTVMTALVIGLALRGLSVIADEGSARAFAEDHHPELAALLDQLRKSAPEEYAAAIAELDASRQHVEGLKRRQPGDYELGLEEWKVMSRIRLRLARMDENADPREDELLRSLVKELLDVRQRALRAEREFVMRRFDRITAALVEYERDPVAAEEQELQSLHKSLKNTPRRPSPPPKQ
jgi:hypothetical protein